MLTKKHFEALVLVCRDAVHAYGGTPVGRLFCQWLAHRLAETCAQGGNPFFDRERFLKATGMKPQGPNGNWVL